MQSCVGRIVAWAELFPGPVRNHPEPAPIIRGTAMTKGRPLTRGIDDAVAIARKRGCVMKFEYGLENTCDLMIRTVPFIVLIRLRRMDKITATPSEIEHACRDIIAELRFFPASPQIVLEIWPYSRHGTYRFFRVNGTGLLELGPDGEPAPAGPAENGKSPQEPGPGPEPGNGTPGPSSTPITPSALQRSTIPVGEM